MKTFKILATMQEYGSLATEEMTFYNDAENAEDALKERQIIEHHNNVNHFGDRGYPRVFVFTSVTGECGARDFERGRIPTRDVRSGYRTFQPPCSRPSRVSF